MENENASILLKHCRHQKLWKGPRISSSMKLVVHLLVLLCSWHITGRYASAAVDNDSHHGDTSGNSPSEAIILPYISLGESKWDVPFLLLPYHLENIDTPMEAVKFFLLQAIDIGDILGVEVSPSDAEVYIDRVEVKSEELFSDVIARSDWEESLDETTTTDDIVLAPVTIHFPGYKVADAVSASISEKDSEGQEAVAMKWATALREVLTDEEETALAKSIDALLSEAHRKFEMNDDDGDETTTVETVTRAADLLNVTSENEEIVNKLYKIESAYQNVVAKSLQKRFSGMDRDRHLPVILSIRLFTEDKPFVLIGGASFLLSSEMELRRLGPAIAMLWRIASNGFSGLVARQRGAGQARPHSYAIYPEPPSINFDKTETIRDFILQQHGGVVAFRDYTLDVFCQ